MAFTPNGTRDSAYAPTRSYEEDLFLENDSDEKKAEILSSDQKSDELSIPDTSSSASDDDLVIAKSSNFFGDDLEDEAGERGDDSDLL